MLNVILAVSERVAASSAPSPGPRMAKSFPRRPVLPVLPRVALGDEFAWYADTALSNADSRRVANSDYIEKTV